MDNDNIVNWDKDGVSVARLVAAIRVKMNSLMVPQMMTVLESLFAISALKSGPDAAFEAQMPRQVAFVWISTAAFRAEKWRPVLRFLQSLPDWNIHCKEYSEIYTLSSFHSCKRTCTQTREALGANETSGYTYSESCHKSGRSHHTDFSFRRQISLSLSFVSMPDFYVTSPL